jgi:hypothetical protein
MVTHIARLGKIIGQYEPEDLEKALADGSVKGGDHWWRQGMTDWKLVSAESPLPPPLPKTEQNAPRAEGDWRIRPKHKPSLYGDEPATEKQLALIKDAGLTDLAGLTKYDASRWLDLILGTDDGRKSLNERQFQAMQERQEQNEKAGIGCDGHRTPSGQYRKEMNAYLEDLKEKEAALREAIAEYPEDEEELLAEFENDKKECQEGVDGQMDMRIDYWLWVIEGCRDDENPYDFGVMVSEDVLPVDKALSAHLFEEGAKIAVVPGRERVKQVLMKLDAASETWDDDQPDLLITTLLKG